MNLHHISLQGMISLTSGSSIDKNPSALNPPASSPQLSAAVSPSSGTKSRKSAWNRGFLKPFRNLVSGNRGRTKESGYDLDMSYISPRILAMAFPATGFEAAYRNPRLHVQEYLQQYHENRYLVFNLCAEPRYQYDVLEFSHKNATEGAVCIPIKDHTVPTLYQIADFCQQAMAWLSQNEENVVVVHCLGGKGRTGLMVACLLLATRICNNAPEAIELFNSMRLKDAEETDSGLRIPSQIRWVKLFEELLILSKHSIPLSITSLSVAKYTWSLIGLEIGPTRAILQSVKIKKRSDEEYIKVKIPTLVQPKVKNYSVVKRNGSETNKVQVIQIELKEEDSFVSNEDSYFDIKMKKGLSSTHVKFWLCSQMAQTMINHRSNPDGTSTLFLNSEDLDSPGNADKELGYKPDSSNEPVSPSLPSERFYVKVHFQFKKSD